MTLRAVAAHAGVSKSLVSRVLQGAPYVSDARREAVENAIRELGYRPNATARNLTQRRTRAVGVLVNDLRQPWFVDFLEGLNTRLHEGDLHAFVGDGRLDRNTDERLLRAFMETRVDGLVLAGTMPTSDTITEAAAMIPTVVAGSRDFELPHVDVIAEDDWLGVEMALDHLDALGHVRIAHISGQQGRVFEIRRSSYESWMARHGLTQHRRVVECDTSEQGGYQAMVTILGRSRATWPTAVFVANDLACVGAMSALREHGIDIPGDMSLVGFDNSFLARMQYISLTSVDIAARQVGRLAAAHLIDRIQSPQAPSRELLVDPGLDVRRSTGAPRPE